MTAGSEANFKAPALRAPRPLRLPLEIETRVDANGVCWYLRDREGQALAHTFMRETAEAFGDIVAAVQS